MNTFDGKIDTYGYVGPSSSYLYIQVIKRLISQSKRGIMAEEVFQFSFFHLLNALQFALGKRKILLFMTLSLDLAFNT